MVLKCPLYISGSEKSVLQEINIDIRVGSRVAFVGPSGSGKTTAANLLLSLLHPHQGNLLLDGIPLLDIEISSWHKCCAKYLSLFSYYLIQ